MNTNIGRAARIINSEHIKCARDLKFPNPKALANDLADAGLLAPDLPEPYVFPSGEREWSSLVGWVNLDTDGTVAVVYDERDEDDIAAGAEIDAGELVFTRISEVRFLALALLAAADYAEREEVTDE